MRAGRVERDFMLTLTGTMRDAQSAIESAELDMGGGAMGATDLAERIRRLKVELREIPPPG